MSIKYSKNYEKKYNTYSEEDSETEESEIEEDWEDKLNLKHKVNLNDNVSLALVCLDKLKLFKLWNLQRSINDDRVNLLTEHYINYYDKHKQLDHTDPIHIAFKKYEKNKNPMYVLDGQHRTCSYIDFLKKRPQCEKLKIQIIIHYIKSEEEFDERFVVVNNRLPFDIKTLMNQKFLKLKELLNDFYCVDGLTFERVTKLKTVTKKFVNVFGLKIRPYINENIFLVNMRSNEFCQKNSPEEIFRKIVKINNQEKYEILVKSKIEEPVKKIMEDLNFYLGYDKNMDWFEKL